VYRDHRPACASCDAGLTRTEIHRDVDLAVPPRSPVARSLSAPRRVRIGTWLGWACESCGGELVADDQLATLLDAATLEVRGLDRRLRPATAPARRCPCCLADMRAHLLYDTVVDRCAAHGVWLDPGERERVVVAARFAAVASSRRTEQAGTVVAGVGAGASLGLGALMSLAALAPAMVAGGALVIALVARARRRELDVDPAKRG
jgi:hypothetical protein